MASGARMVTLIPVRDMSRAIRFYTKVLGGKLQYRGMGEMKNFWASLSVGGSDVWFVNPPEREKRKLAYQTFVVKDIRRYVAKLKQRRVKFEKAQRMGRETKVEGPIAIDTFGASAFFKDSEGNLLMAWQDFTPM